MKKKVNIARAFALAAVCLLMTSCYTLTYSVGRGAQKGITLTEKNHYLINGLAGIKTAEPAKMIGDATDYTVIISHTFIDGLISFLTSGIYTPTTIQVIK